MPLRLSEFFELKLDESVGFFYIQFFKSKSLTGRVFVKRELFEK